MPVLILLMGVAAAVGCKALMNRDRLPESLRWWVAICIYEILVIGLPAIPFLHPLQAVFQLICLIFFCTLVGVASYGRYVWEQIQKTDQTGTKADLMRHK